MFFNRKAVKGKLLPDNERQELIRQYGEAIRPILEKLLDAKAEELSQRYEGSWEKWLAEWKAEAVRENDQVLVTRDDAAQMLGISLPSVKRLEERGELPKPRRFGKRNVRHKLSDILAFAKGTGLPNKA